MNIGIRLHDTLPGTLNERLGHAERQGFTCAHLAMSKAVAGFCMQEAPAQLTPKLARQVKDAFAAHHLQCAVLGCYLNLADPDAESRRRTQEIYRAHLRFAPLIGALVVGTETYANPQSHFDKPAPQSEEALEFFIESLRPVVRFAEEENAVLAIEPVASHIVSTPERAQRVLDALPSDHLQIILDAVNLLSPENAAQADAVVEDALRRLGDRVRVLHMKDFRLEDGRVRSMACGTGGMRYERLLAFGMAHDLPMTLEDTVPDNAEAARHHLEHIAETLRSCPV